MTWPSTLILCECLVWPGCPVLCVTGVCACVRACVCALYDSCPSVFLLVVCVCV